MKKFLFLLCSLLFSVAGAWATITMQNTAQVTGTGGFVDGKLYAVRVNGGSYITESGEQYVAPNTQNAITDEALYYIVLNADGETFTVKNLATGNYWGQLTGAAVGTFAPSAEPADWTFTFSGNNVQASSGGFYINRSSGVLHGWSTAINLQFYEVSSTEVLSSLDELSNEKAYKLTTPRGTLGVSDGQLVSTIKGYEASDFAVVKSEDNYYLWSVVAKSFVKSNGKVSNEEPEAITFQPISEGVWQLRFGNNAVNISSGYTPGLVINDWVSVDDGNKYFIIEAADFDPFEAIAVLDPSTAQPKNLDFSESTPVGVGIHTYVKDIQGSNVAQMQPVEGWTMGVENGDARAAGVFAYGDGNFVGGDGYIVPATNPEGNVEGNALGFVGVWSATVQYVQKVILEPANYILTIPVYNSKGGNNVPVKSLIGFIAEDGTEYLAPAKAYPVDTWTNEVITFSLNEKTTGYLTLGYQGQDVGSGSAQHLFIDAIKIETATNAEVVRAELIAALAAPTATVEAHAGVGTGLFMIPEAAYDTFAAAVAAAQAVADNAEATAEELEAAIAALAAAVEAYAAAEVNTPAEGTTYSLQQKSSGLYMALDAAADIVKLADEPQEFTWTATEGGYYLHNEAGYVGQKTNNWTTSVLEANKIWVKATPVEIDGAVYYTLTEPKGMIATDNETAGSACYLDKSIEKSGDKAYWSITAVKTVTYVALQQEIAKAEAMIAATEIENGKADLQAAIDAAKAELGKTDEEMAAAIAALQAAEEAFAAAQQEASVVYIETDLTTSFAALTVNTNWRTGAGGTAGYTATNFCPMVTTNAGQTVQVCEFYEANCNRTGDLLYQTVSGLAEGVYRIELYGAAAYTFGRGFTSTAFSEGTWNAGDHIDENTGVVLYAETSEGNYGGEIPIYYATNFPDGAATVVLDGVKVGANGQVKIGMSKTSTSTNWHVIQLKGVTAKVLGSDALAAVVALAEAIDPETLPAKAYEELTAVVAENNKTYATAEAYVAAIDAINAAIVKANKYVAANAYFVKMADVLNNTNVYTEEAYNAYYGDWKADFEDVALDDATLATLTADAAYSTGWHSSNNIDDILLSAWTINDVQAKDFDTALYINTWSTEGDTDGSEFKVPFFEYWTGDANSLDAATLTATMTDLPVGRYEVSVWARVRGKNGFTAPTFGITADVNGGEAIDLAAGELVEGSQFYLAEFKATGVVGEDGVLKFNINVAADNNISWLSFKNVKYTQTADATELAYEAALAAIENGGNYRIFTEVGENKFYLKADGYLTDSEDDAKIFTLNAVNASGTVYETGWDLGCKFTNPDTGGNTTFTNEGHILVGSNNRNDWERQVFFLKNGKYAVRATNANNVAWGSNTYWDVFENGELPEAGYSLEAAYVWQLQDMALVVGLAELQAIIDRGNAFAVEKGDANIPALAAIDVNAITTVEALEAAIAEAKAAIADYIASLEVGTGIDITNGALVNPTPVENQDGWEGNRAGDQSNGVAEYWNAAGSTLHQTVTLPAGDYKLTVIALQRTDMTGYVYAGEEQTVIATVDKTTANSRAQAATWFDGGNGVNDVYFVLDETTEVEIGLKADDTTGDHWTVWRSFTLTKLPEGTVVGVGNVETDVLNHNSDVIYDLAGRRVSKAVKGGIYILNGKKVVIK
ncbi:MAG: hypothetical protein IJ064_01680 [Bacteroidaceae bacterium]|nr:hypothetical protein [Bacteroidaceae bacterium]